MLCNGSFHLRATTASRKCTMRAHLFLFFVLLSVLIGHRVLAGRLRNKFQGLTKNFRLPNSASPSQNVTELSSDRQERLLSLFTVVRFNNGQCTGLNSYNGTCLTSAECTAAGGTGSGSCASGFGICCVFTVTTCGQTVSRNNTYFQNPGGVGTSYTKAGQCLITIQKCSPDVCQLRLDFLTFSISQPEPQDQKCALDIFTTSGASNNIPPICGENSGQHIYLDMTMGQNSWSLGFITAGTNVSRNWNIRATQIPCDSRLTAPDQCLQYYRDAVGTISSFNYAPTALATALPATTGRQLSNQDYLICIRKNQGFCGICYTACQDPTNNSTLQSSFTVSSVAGLFTPASGADGSCTTDWLGIPCASDTMNSATLSDGTSCVNKLCGTVFSAIGAASRSATVYSYSAPFELRYHTDGTEVTNSEVGNMGFCLNYVQQPCTTLG